jgi:6-pyruvoyltetrahydropterin/6-carboxytetrahydropterin synthase
VGAKNKVYVTKRFQFEAAHHLHNYDGKCSNVHGHSYKLEVTVSKPVDFNPSSLSKAKDAMVLDFSVLKSVVNDVAVSLYDHSNLNEHFGNYPTAELMVVSMFEDIQECFDGHYPAYGIKVEEVKLWETEDSYATYRGEEV